MNRTFRATAAILLVLSTAAFAAKAPGDKKKKKAAPATPAATTGDGMSPDAAQALYEQVTPSLVAVKYTWESELGRRDLIGAGVVVSDDGLVMISIGAIPNLIPDAQIKDFKIIIPSQEKDPDELTAVFQGRDERTNLAFVKVKTGSPKDAARVWKPMKFEEAPVKVGEPLVSVGLLPEGAAFKTYLMQSRVAVTLRGDVPQVLVQGGGLAAVGSPVFNEQGKAVGIVGIQMGQNSFLNDENNSLNAVNSPPKFYTPSRDFLQSLGDPPVAGTGLKLPWIGVPQMTGLNKDVSEVYSLVNQPAVQIGEVIPDTPAAASGLKQGDIIIKVNGEPLERGDEPAELPGILRRKILRMKVGEEVTLSVIHKRGQPPEDLHIKLAEQPSQANTAKRFFAEDLGFAVRDLVFIDRYARRMPSDGAGVVVALIRPQSAAQSGGLQGNGTLRSDVVIQLNGQPVKDVEDFEQLFKNARKDKPKDPVVFVVRREGREDTVRLEPPQ